MRDKFHMHFPSLRRFLADRSWRCAIVAHRGAWREAPENSIAAIKAAAAQGYQFAEIDLRRTADDVFVCLHDETLTRTTERDGRVSDLTWAELFQTRLRERRGGPNAAVTQHTIARLEDILRLVNDKIYIDLDVKEPTDLPFAAHVIASNDMSEQVNLKAEIVDAADASAIEEIERESGILVKPVIVLNARNTDDFGKLLDFRRWPLVEVVCDSFETLTRFSEMAASSGTDLFVNTLDEISSSGITDEMALNNPARGWGALVNCGVRIIQTDHPAALKSFLSTQISAQA